MYDVIDRAHARSDVAQKMLQTCTLQCAWSLSIEVEVNFRACVCSELLKWIG